MDRYDLLVLVSPDLALPKTGAASPRSVLAAIASLVGPYVARQSATASATALANALNHIPFLAPAGQSTASRTIAAPGPGGAFPPLAEDLVASALPEARALLAGEPAAAELAAIEARARAALATSHRADILILILSAVPAFDGASPLVCAGIAQRSVSLVAPPGTAGESKLAFADTISTYRFDFAALADGEALARWRRFVAQNTPPADPSGP